MSICYNKLSKFKKVEGERMNLPVLFIIVGTVVFIASFFIGNQPKKLENEVEELSLQFYQETNQLKHRIKAVEEELMMDSPLLKTKTIKQDPHPRHEKTNINNIHQILISQVLALHQQGYTVPEISQRSSLTQEQVHAVITSRGGRL